MSSKTVHYITLLLSLLNTVAIIFITINMYNIINKLQLFIVTLSDFMVKYAGV